MPDPGWEANSNVGLTSPLHPSIHKPRARLGSVPRPHIIIADSSLSPSSNPSHVSSLPPLPISPISPSRDSIPSSSNAPWNSVATSSPTLLASTAQSYLLGENPSSSSRNPAITTTTLVQDLTLDDVHLWVSGRASLARAARKRDRDSQTQASGPVITMSSASNPSTSSLGTNASESVGASGTSAGGGVGGSSDNSKNHSLRGK